jgi:hypothetical protein
MVMLIPFLLSSSEFVKMGAIELKLPESAQGAGSGANVKQDAKLELGVVITAKGFTLFHYFKQEKAAAASGQTVCRAGCRYSDCGRQIRLCGTERQTGRCQEKKFLFEIVRAYYPSTPPDATLLQLAHAYESKNLSGTQAFADHEAIKIVAEDKIKYQTVVAVMDAARGTATPNGNVTMFSQCFPLPEGLYSNGSIAIHTAPS